jgi:hypothetical protein
MNHPDAAIQDYIINHSATENIIVPLSWLAVDLGIT